VIQRDRRAKVRYGLMQTSSRRAMAVLTAAVLAITALPYLYARISTPSDLVYTGLMLTSRSRAVLVVDHRVAHRAVHQQHDDARGQSRHIREPDDVALAQTQAAFGLPFSGVVPVVARAGDRLLVPALMAFVNIMMPERERRVSAMLIALFGAGFGWMLIVAKKVSGTADVSWPTDLIRGAQYLLVDLAYPHIAFAQALILLTMLGACWRIEAKAGRIGSCRSRCRLAFRLTRIRPDHGLCGAGRVRYRDMGSRSTIPDAADGGGACSRRVLGPAALYYQRLTSGDPLCEPS